MEKDGFKDNLDLITQLIESEIQDSRIWFNNSLAYTAEQFAEIANDFNIPTDLINNELTIKNIIKRYFGKSESSWGWHILTYGNWGESDFSQEAAQSGCYHLYVAQNGEIQNFAEDSKLVKGKYTKKYSFTDCHGFKIINYKQAEQNLNRVIEAMNIQLRGFFIPYIKDN